MSATMTATSTITAAALGNEIITWVTLGINVLILISNALLDIYRKWRDRDNDKKSKENSEKDETKNE